jgi:hypothetical protein
VDHRNDLLSYMVAFKPKYLTWLGEELTKQLQLKDDSCHLGKTIALNTLPDLANLPHNFNYTGR